MRLQRQSEAIRVEVDSGGLLSRSFPVGPGYPHPKVSPFGLPRLSPLSISFMSILHAFGLARRCRNRSRRFA